ncbi:MAG: DUF262 domain-containing protein [Dehalococcoidia bacterium]|nr:DUF262 domain-containing protein [Dehalococcoidia bacterium]
MREIRGMAKTVRELLSGVKYSIDYYQREYKWGQKQVRELIEDLVSRFLEDHRQDHERQAVAEYGHYFLGSIIITRKGNTNYIVDGQQRLTSLTLLLIFLNNLQRNRSDRVNVDELIYSVKFSKKTFNIEVDERTACMEALLKDQTFDETDEPESVQNIMARYRDIQELFPEEIRDKSLPYFIDWLMEKVYLVEISADTDEDSYTIFETMNDRGLSLSPTDMLKGYLLANITDRDKRIEANRLWRQRVMQLNDNGDEAAADFFKTWLRSQYAMKIRERKKGAIPEDFDRIGTEFHRWVRDFHRNMGLEASEDFARFIEQDLDFYSRQYLRLIQASRELVPGLEHVLYNAHHGFTLQYQLLLAPLKPDDPKEEIDRKLRLVAMFVDILLTRRLWNFRSIAYSTMQYTMFLHMRDIRRLDSHDLALKLRQKLDEQGETFETNEPLYIHQQNRWYIHRVLARITDYIERQSDMESHYMEYVSGERKSRYEIEHIWADKPERHADEFSHPNDFSQYRNHIGGLLLLPKQFNASYGDLPYKDKLPHYNAKNLLARSLHPQCYEHNPGFLKFVKESGLPFQAHPQFKRADLDARQDLLRQIAERIWDPERLTQGTAV